MIKAFKIINYLGEELYLDIRKPEDTGFLITSVTGLNDPQIEIASQNYTTYDGSDVGNLHVTQRNIVMNIVFYEDNTEKISIEDLRWKLQSYFPPKTELSFYAINDHGSFSIKGYVETCDVNIFTKQEGAQISILCPDPNFILENANNTTVIGTIEPIFHFPVSIESFELIDKSLEFGFIKKYPSTSVIYKGSSVTGIIIKIEIKTNVISNLRINNVTRGEYIVIDYAKLNELVGGNFQKYDEITIDTRKGKKSVTLLRNAVSYNILNACLPVKKWPQLQTGENVFTYSASNDIDCVDISINFDTRFLGI